MSRWYEQYTQPQTNANSGGQSGGTTTNPRRIRPPAPQSGGGGGYDDDPNFPAARQESGTTTPAPATPTFADMAATGRARPAPPPAPRATASAPTATVTAGQRPQVRSSTGTDIDQQVRDAVSGLLARPSAYDDEVIKTKFGSLAGEIDDDFALQQRRTDEEMARRGLHASSIAGGRLHDLNIGRRDARTRLAERMMIEAAQQRSQDTDRAIRSGMDLSGREFSQDMETRRASFMQEMERAGFDRDTASRLFEQEMARSGFSEGQYQFDANQMLAYIRMMMENGMLDEQGGGGGGAGGGVPAPNRSTPDGPRERFPVDSGGPSGGGGSPDDVPLGTQSERARRNNADVVASDVVANPEMIQTIMATLGAAPQAAGQPSMAPPPPPVAAPAAPPTPVSAPAVPPPAYAPPLAQQPVAGQTALDEDALMSLLAAMGYPSPSMAF